MTATNEMLSNSEIRYNYLIGSIPEVIGELDLDGTISFVNPQVYDLLGYHPDELIGTNFIKFIHPDDVSDIKKAIKKAVKSKEVLLPSLRLKHKKGNYILVFAKGKLIKLSDKARLIGVIRAEKELLLERYNLINIFNSMADGVYIVDQNYDIEYVNPILTKEFGRYEGKKCYKYFHDREEVCPWCKNQEVFKGKTVRWEWYSAKNQKIYDLIDTPLKNIDGSVSKLEIFRDITEHKKAEKEIIASEKKYRSLVEGLNEALYRIALPDGNYEYFSPAVKFVFGYSSKDFLDNSMLIKEIMHPDFSDYFKEKWADLLKGNVPRTYEYKIIDPDNHERWITQSNKRIIDSDGNIIAIEGLCRDITEYKKTELIESGESLKQINIELEKRVEKRITGLIKSERIFKSIFMDSPIGIELYDSNGKLNEANKACCDMFGVSNSREIEGFDLFSDPNIPKNEMEKLKNGKIIRYEAKFDFDKIKQFNLYNTSKSGKSYLDVMITPLYIEDKQDISNYLVQIQDTTEQHNLEAELHNIFNLSLNMIGSAGNDAFFKRINPAVGKTLGYTDQELLGWSFIELIHPNDVESTLKELETLSEGKPTVDFVNRYRCKNGTYKWIEWNTKPIPEEEINYFVAQDVTARKLNEIKLKEYAEKLEFMVEERTHSLKVAMEKTDLYLNLVEVIIVALDRDGKITMLNKKGYSLLEYEEGKLVGKDWFEMCLPKQNRKVVYEVFKKLMQNEIETTEFYENPILTKSGEEKIIAWRNTLLLDNKGEIIGTIGAGVDITERRKTQKKLKESEEKYRSLVEDAQEGVWALDENENTIFVNPRICEMLGYTKNEMMGKNIHLLIPDSMKERIKGNRIKREKGIKETYDLELLKKNGTIIYTKIKAAPIMSESRDYKGSFAYITDITTQRHAEDTLRESEELFRTLFEIAPAAIIVSDLESNITLFNQKFCNLHGITQPELLKGRKIQEFIAERDKPKIKEAMIKTFRGELRGSIQYTMHKEDGTEFLTEGISSVLKDKKGKNIGLIGVAQDITERVRSEQKLKESEEKYRALFENTPIGVTISNYEGHVIEINENMKKLLGYELEELKKLGIAVAYANDQDRIPFKNQLEERGYIKDYEVDLKKKDGKVFPALLNSIKTNITGGPIYINTIRDITEKKEIEEIKNHLLTRFSHEFKTPLISINGFSDLLLSEYKNKLDEKMIGFVERIKDGGERLKLLVNAFMQSSQLGEKLTSLNIDKENLSNLIKLGVSEMQGLIHLRKHTINMDIHEKLIGEFDKEKIYSVITNLLMNAIKYTPPEGKIFIHSKIEEEDIFFSIKDSGIGLTEEEKGHLFKPFGKIERYGKGWDIVSEGMGVGLYLSKELICLHGGKIWAESEGKNKGSTFYFSFPMTNN